MRCLAELTLNTTAFDLVDKAHSITEVFKRDLAVFEVWAGLFKARLS